MAGFKKKKTKNFITPLAAVAETIFADVHGSGSNCKSTAKVDRVALILGYPFPPKGDESTIFS